MRRHRVFSLRKRNATRTIRWIWKGIQALCVIGLALLVTSCVAQRSDLVKMEEDFEEKISKLDREKRTLAQTLEQAKRNIEASKAVLVEQKNELNELKKARARINSDLQSLREEILSKVTSESETQSHRLDQGLDQVNRKLAALTRKDAVLKELLEQGDAERSTQIDVLRKDVEGALAKQTKQVSTQFTDFQKSLVEFKKILAQVDKRLVQEQDRATGAEATVQQDFTKQQRAFQAKLEAFQTKLDADTRTLKTYVETSVKTTIATVNKALKKITDRLDADAKAQAAQLSKLNTKLGTELAALAKKLAALSKKLAASTKKLAASTKKLNTDTASIQTYLEKDVPQALEAISEVVEREKGRVSQELARMETALQKAERTVAANVTQTQTRVTAQAKNVEELRQAVVQMRGVLDSMGDLLGKRGDDQMKQVGQTMARLDRLEQAQSSETAKQAENTQAISTHLNEVTASVESAVQSFEQFKTALTARLNEQATQLQKQAERVASSAEASAVQRLQQELKANVKHWNELSRSIAKLKDASNALVTKLGSKIDEHEVQIVELQNALSQTRQPVAPKPTSP